MKYRTLGQYRLISGFLLPVLKVGPTYEERGYNFSWPPKSVNNMHVIIY